MLSTRNLKQTDARDHTDARDNEDVLVARIEEQLSKLAHDAAGQPAAAPSVADFDLSAARPVPPTETMVRPAAVETIQLPDLKHTDAFADPHDFVPIALGEPFAVGEPAAPANDTVRLPASQLALGPPVISPRLENLRVDQRLNPSLDPPPRKRADFSASRPIPSVDAMFRPGAANAKVQLPDEPSLGSRAGRAVTRALTGFVLALIGVGATYAWQTHGDEAERIMAKWTPQSVLSWLPLKTSTPPAQPTPLPVQAAVANPAPAEPAPPQPAPETQAATAQTAAPVAPQDVTPSAAAPALPPDVTQQLQAMARDLATAQQEIEQLKASRDQMARELAKVTDQNARRTAAAPRATTPPPRPPAALAHRPVPGFPAPPPITRQPVSQQPIYQQPISQQPVAQRPVTPQSMAQPQPMMPPPQAAAPPPQANPQTSSVPRPPMPLSPD